MLTAEQMMVAHKANLETLHGLTQKAFEGVAKLMDLNIQATKAALTESASNTQALLSIKDAQELLALQAALMQPLTEKATAYSRQIYEIASATSGAFAQVAEAQGAQAQHKLQSVVDNIAKNAPAGSENAVATLKSSMTAATQAMENVQKAVKQASEMAEKNFHAATRAGAKTPSTGSARKR